MTDVELKALEDAAKGDVFDFHEYVTAGDVLAVISRLRAAEAEAVGLHFQMGELRRKTWCQNSGHDWMDATKADGFVVTACRNCAASIRLVDVEGR